jgi:hypothetical protein
MNTAAVVIGVNAYKTTPLTSAINDAKAFREALLKHNLVTDSEINMFTSPSESGWPEATRKNINDALYNLYKNRDDIDQFFFFFSGHGMLTYVKGDMRTVLMPVDVEDLDRDAGSLIDFGELRGYMRHGGPRQQFYFIDACRDLNPAKDPPTVGALAWRLRDPLTPALAQATLFAVSELGKARGAVEGMAVMTGDLIKALDGAGLATDFDDSLNNWVVSMKSIGNYVKDAVEQKLFNEPAYLRAYMRPQLDDPDPSTEPLRFLSQVEDKPLTISIKPEWAAGDTNVILSVRSIKMRDYCLPPRKNREPFLLPPQPYLVEATYLPDSSVEVDPSRKTVDLRKEHQVEITVRLPGSSPPPDDPGDGPRAPDILIEGLGAEPTFSVRGEMAVMDYVAAAANAPQGRIMASALESQVAIEVEALQPPYQKWTGYFNLDQQLPTGSYRVRFRLGIDVFNETTLYVKAGQTMNVTTTVDAPPLVREALKMSGSLPRQTLISESIGNIQAGLLQTMLPLLGVKPFDSRDEILHQFTGLVEPQDPKLFRMHPFSLVVAIDGNRWGDVRPADILQSIDCRTDVHTHAYESEMDAGFSFTPVEMLELKALSRATLQDSEEPEPNDVGFKRVGMAVSTAPAPSFELRLKSPYLGEYGLACASIEGRATVVTLTFRPDGSTDISQNILRLPGREDLYAEELAPNVSYGRMVRELQLGQQLYRSGELIEQRRMGHLPAIISDLFYAKWTDPILSCMAFLEWQRYSEAHPDGPPDFDSALLGTTATNLRKYFFNLPDSHVIYGLAFREERSEEFDYLLKFDRVPVLAESVRILARYAAETGRDDATVVRFARRMSVRQSWASTIRTDEVLSPSVTISAASAMTATAEAEAEKTQTRSGAAGA